MKAFFLLLALLCVMSAPLFSQTDAAKSQPAPVKVNGVVSVGDDAIYYPFDVTKAPEFPGGENAMARFIGEKMQYPAFAREKSIQGSVAVSFVINKDGSISDITILKDIGGGCGKEAVRVIGLMPKWTPGELNGKPVRVLYTKPFKFSLGH